MKKVIALLLALTLVMLCAGCSGPAGTSAGTTESSVAATGGNTPAETAGQAGTETIGDAGTAAVADEANAPEDAMETPVTIRYEGEGFRTPEEAVAWYLDGLKNLDFEQMLGAFAWETMISHLSVKDYLLRLNAYTSSAVPQFPGESDMARTVNLEAMREQEADLIYRSLEGMLYNDQYALGSVQDGITVILRDEDSIREYMQSFDFRELDKLAGMTNIRFPSVEAATGGSFSGEEIQKFIDRQYAWYGADEIVAVPAVADIGDEKLFVAPTAARYGDRWYLVTLNSSVSSALGLTINQLGFLVLSELPYGREEDVPVWTAPEMAGGNGEKRTIRYEGDGFSTPENAMTWYLDGLKNLDADRMLRAFAWETQIAHYSVTDMFLQQKSVAGFTAARLPMENSPFLAAADMHSLRKLQITYIRYSLEAIFIPRKLAGYTLAPLTGEEGEKVFGYFDWNKLEPLRGMANIRFISPDEATGMKYSSDFMVQNRAKQYARFGADETRDMIAAADLPDGRQLMVFAVAARYGDKWYLVTLGNQASSIIGMSMQYQAFVIGTEAEADEPKATEEPKTDAQIVEGYLAEADAYAAAAEAGMRNIAGYMGQLESYRSLVAGAGGDTEVMDGFISDADGILKEAEANKADFDDRMQKVRTSCDGYENLGEADMSKLLSTIPKHLNLLKKSLKRITKIDQVEVVSNRSAETRMQKLCEQAAQWLAETYPDLDPGEVFVPETVMTDGQ